MDSRVRALNSAPVRGGARYVLYWAQMNRRVDGNHGLLYAAEIANRLGLPLLFYEGLTCSYPHANDRLHTFILQGVPDTAKRLRRMGIGYAFYLRRRHSEPNDVVYKLAARAAAVVTDDYPVFIAARHNASFPAKLDVACYAVDSSCVVPMSRVETRQYGAYTIRPKIRKLLGQYLRSPEPLRVRRRYEETPPEWHTEVRDADVGALTASCEIDHSVPVVPGIRGGASAAGKQLREFLEHRLSRYARERNQPAAHATSGLSPYLHFGHISSLEAALAAQEYAAEHKLIADEFLEELIVRRELAFNFARHTPEVTSLGALPDWVQQTMAAHAGDPRPAVYSRPEFEQARTHDALWNATQKELLLTGRIHGYYRMYWGKKIIEWSETHEDALRTMIFLHDRYALDGRDPNTYANILWCFGLHDRPWFERPVFGKIRSMTLTGMRRKTDADAYIREIGEIEERT